MARNEEIVGTKVTINGQPITIPELNFEIRNGTKGKFLTLDRKGFILMSAEAIKLGIDMSVTPQSDNNLFEA